MAKLPGFEVASPERRRLIWYSGIGTAQCMVTLLTHCDSLRIQIHNPESMSTAK